MTNEEEIVKNIIFPLGQRLRKGLVTYKLCQILNCHLTLDPSSPFLNLGNGIRESKYNYLYNELQWYMSKDLSIKGHSGIEGNPIWQGISTDDGKINSNYGYLVFDERNYSQYDRALSQMYKNKDTKHAVLIYTRPQIVNEWNDNVHAKSDFICTYATSFMIQDNKLYMNVHMRSNDFFTGFFNDFAWQVFIYRKFMADVRKKYDVQIGSIFWNTDNMHVYERDYALLQDLYNYYKGK